MAGRKKNTLTPTQQDSSLFAQLSIAASRIGARQLAAHCKVSHETIYKYCRRLAVCPGTEEQITLAISAHNAERLARFEQSKATVRAALNRIDEDDPKNK